VGVQRAALVTAGIGSCGMAAFQLYVPRLYGWDQYLSLMPPHMAWTMHAVNVFFSFLIAWGGFLTVLAGARPKKLGGLGYPILYGLAIFWVVNVVYQIRVRAPFPPGIANLVLGATVAIALLYLFYLVTRNFASETTANSSTTQAPQLKSGSAK
jgi:hypothetical protein